MLGKSVTWKGSIQVGHQLVAINLGDNRSRCNREVDSIALVKAVLRLWKIGNRSAVDEDVLRQNLQRGNSGMHGPKTRVIDVEPVDLLYLDNTDADGSSLRTNPPIQVLPRLLIKRLGIINALNLCAWRKNYGSSHDRTSQGPDAYFIHSRNVNDARLPK